MFCYFVFFCVSNCTKYITMEFNYPFHFVVHSITLFISFSGSFHYLIPNRPVEFIRKSGMERMYYGIMLQYYCLTLFICVFNRSTLTFVVYMFNPSAFIPFSISSFRLFPLLP
ncbi:hypothetical protein HanXRQr2_Chr08g0353921 [Helianthus annuus]|uniref:Uncharacterized protein n=1 Tax=Helianthus annuus TaxID=4232 RepID=A0A9K3IHF3_HELAN|nr:hypothetical protein HanXRQr2_Chr08g0353921 [Helianthus annuus]KAJ0902829.1 hypothetical protein HanPSC8_Chr08g0341751 [Helianthus annuus]